MKYIYGIIFVVLLFSQAYSYPRFAAKYEQKCGLCHVNPTGCGMRNIYGSQFFATGELPAHKIPQDKVIKTNFTDHFMLGMDARNLYIYNENNNPAIYPNVPGGKQSTFFQMEADLNLNAQLTDRLSLFFKRDINTVVEVYGLGNYLPAQGYIKVGKFQPSYGWRFQDHTSFVRDPMTWYPFYYDTGIELGIYPDNFSANIGFFNGTSDVADNNRGKAIAGRLEYRLHLNPIGLGIGGSYWRNDFAPNTTDEYGPFYYLKLFNGNLVYLGEIDWLKFKATAVKQLATTHNVSLQICQGVWIEGDYDFIDPDTRVKAGTVSRYGLNLDYFPIGYVEIQPTVRYFDDKLLGKKYWNLVLQSHLYF
jgi:hypothetical protein